MFSDYPATKILSDLERDDLLPAILFRSARKQCDQDIEKLEGSNKLRLRDAERQKIEGEIAAVIQKYGFEPDVITGHAHYGALLETGAGAHHAGQLLMWRLLLEELMSRGALRLLIATGTVAAGVDFPARTVVITAHSKRGNEGFNVLSSAEFQQMSGRAGRRGKDTVGICVVAPSRFSDARIIAEVSKRPPEPLRSAYFAAPSTVLNLLKYRNVDDLRYTVSRSLAAFLDRKAAGVIRDETGGEITDLENGSELRADLKKRLEKRIRRKMRDAEILEARQETLLLETLSCLQKLGHLEGDSLSAKGYWAAELCTTLVLELAEAIHEGLFYDLSVPELVGLVASFAGDAHRVYYSLSRNPIKKEYFSKLQGIVERVREVYPRAANSELKVVPDAALTAMAWMEAKDWGEFSGLLRLGGVAEGDVARLISQTADHLNQISKLIESHPPLAQAAAEGRKLILKPPLSEALPVD